MAIDNIADKCQKRLDLPLDKLSLEEKLTKIKVSSNSIHNVASVYTYMYIY